MLQLRFLGVIACSSLLVLSACSKGGDSSGTGNDVPPTPNAAPTVDAGNNQSVFELTLVSLSAIASDSDGTVETVAWAQTSGTNVILSETSSADSSFTAPDVSTQETLSFLVTVTDDEGDTATDTVDITVNPIITATRSLNDTGITLCGDYAYDGGSATHNNDVNCALTDDSSESKGGDPVPAGQDGHYGRDVDTNNNTNGDGHSGFSFTKLDPISGADLPANSNSGTWGCVRDNVTGLIWEVKETRGLRDAAHTYTWYNSTGTNDGGRPGYGDTGTGTTTDVDQAGSDNCEDDARCDTEKFVADVNALAEPLCGYTDWRLPTVEELGSIAHLGTTNPAIDTDYFPNTQSSLHWSSSPYAYGSNYAWVLTFGYGNDGSLNKYLSHSVRLVRGQ